MLAIPCVEETLPNRMLSNDVEFLGEGGAMVGVASEGLALGVGSTELDGVEKLGVIWDDMVDNDASDPKGKHRKQ